MNIQCSGGSRSFAKETRALEMRNVVDNDQLRAVIKADPPTTTREVDEELHDHATVIRHLKQIRKVKKLNKWVPHELNANQKK